MCQYQPVRFSLGLIVAYKDPDYQKKWYQRNKERIKRRRREYYQNNKIKEGERQREYDKQHKERRQEYIEEYRKIHREQLKMYAKYYAVERRKDPKYKLNNNISIVISHSLKDGKNGRHWENVVDFTQKELREHLENQFKKGMTWSNYGEWHVDHEIPVSVFNFDSYTDLDFRRCWSLSNLRPMWAKENMKKSNKINKPFQPNLKL